jgi:pimeloyl-ACP methyl ester carboxylesterase
VIVFVHGVPETDRIWRKVRERVQRPSVALSLPGFGCPRPDGFAATKDAYVDWLLGELAAIDEPVDLVGHDWGAGLTYGVVTRHPGAVRSWVADVGNLLHPDYVWHDFAQIWQTPGEGEAFVAAQAAQEPAEAAATLGPMFGIDAADALEVAEGQDDVMGACILDLYRSATPNPFAHWGPWSPTADPGLILDIVEDPFGDSARAAEVAGMLGAQLVQVEGTGHFWPYSGADAAVPVLEAFWSGLD